MASRKKATGGDDQLPLNGVPTPTNGHAKKKPAVEGTSRCLAAFYDGVRARHGIEPLKSPGKDGKLMQALIRTWGENVVLELIGDYFTDRDDLRILRSGFTVGAFYGLAQYLLLRRSSRLEPTINERNMAAARQAMEPRH